MGMRILTPLKRVIRSIPEKWVVKNSRHGGGVKLSDPDNQHNVIRIMPGDPKSPYPNSRNPYVKRVRNGTYVDKNGNPVLHNSAEAHIPIDEFSFKATDK
mgnify:CR=1 FL=1